MPDDKAKQQVQELEQKVKVLESNKERDEQVSEGKTKQRIEALDQQLKSLERKRELDQETAETKAREAPTVSLASNGLVVRSADSNFLMNVHGYVQADARFYFNDRDQANDTFLLRRVRPIIEGTVFNQFDYRLMPDRKSVV